MKNDETKTEIKQYLEKVCSHFPTDKLEECKKKVDKIYQETIENLSGLCYDLKLCPNDQTRDGVNVNQRSLVYGHQLFYHSQKTATLTLL